MARHEPMPHVEICSGIKSATFGELLQIAETMGALSIDENEDNTILNRLNISAVEFARLLHIWAEVYEDGF